MPVGVCTLEPSMGFAIMGMIEHMFKQKHDTTKLLLHIEHVNSLVGYESCVSRILYQVVRRVQNCIR